MTLRPQTEAEILEDMVDHVRTKTNLTDYNPGSNIRTILEAAARNDADQNFQIVQVLKAFSYRTASGMDLIRRARDFNLSKQSASPAYGEVLILDGNLERSYLVVDAAAGSINISVEDASIYTAGLPFDIKVSEGQTEEEIASVTVVNTSTNILTLAAPLTDNHIGVANPLLITIQDEVYLDRARVSYVDGGADRVLNSGILVSAPAIGELNAVVFTTSTSGVLYNGNFKSDVISVRANKVGLAGNVGPQRVIEFPANVPFSDAAVVNMESTGGGNTAETDTEFVDRIILTMNALGGATVSAIIASLLTVVVPTTRQRVARINVFEEFVRDATLPGDGKVVAYIDDGSGDFDPDIEELAFGNANGIQPSGAATFDSRITEGTFAGSGWILVDEGRPGEELIQYDSIAAGAPGIWIFTLTGGTVTAKNHADGDIVLQVEILDSSTEADRKFYRVDHIALVEEYFRLFKLENLVITELVRFDPDAGHTIATSDYFFNSGTGQLELINIPVVGSVLFSYLHRYTGLIEAAQRVLTGDVRDPATYPGVSAAGIRALVLAANRLEINVHITLILDEGANREEAKERADRVIRNYINSLTVGADFIVYRMVKKVMKVNGVYNLAVHLPISDIIVDYDVIPSPGIITVV